MQLNMMPVGDTGKIGDTVKAFAAMSNAMRDTCAEGVRFMTQYPPAPASSRYVRTGKLKDSWNSDIKSGNRRIEGVIGSAANIAPYNTEVQGEQQEEIFNRIGWRNTEDLKSKVEKDFPDRMQKEVDKVFN